MNDDPDLVQVEITSRKNVEVISRKDIREAAKLMSDEEVRFLVKSYYTMQENRIRAKAQVRELNKEEEPNVILDWLGEQNSTLEKNIEKAMDEYTKAHKMGAWLRGILGIGPVLSAGLLAYFDIERAPTVGHFWSIVGWAGKDQKPWEKGKLRPFNQTMRTLCWKIGDSFVKLSNREDCPYGQVYRQRKAYETAKNEAGDYAEQAAAELKRKNFGKTTEAYKHYTAGHLPPAHIDARARRYAVKLFLAHFHDEWYQQHYGKPAPLPYPIAHLGHAHKIESF